MLKSINKYATAPLAPTTLPAGALMLVEIGGQVFRQPATGLSGLSNLPTTVGAAAVGQVWSDNGVLKTKMA